PGVVRLGHCNTIHSQSGHRNRAGAARAPAVPSQRPTYSEQKIPVLRRLVTRATRFTMVAPGSAYGRVRTLDGGTLYRVACPNLHTTWSSSAGARAMRLGHALGGGAAVQWSSYARARATRRGHGRGGGARVHRPQ